MARETVGDEKARGCAEMRARAWTIAFTYYTPTDYDIPSLPDWHVSHRNGRLTFAEHTDETPFITAAQPVRVRR